MKEATAMPAKSHPKKRVLFGGNLLTYLLTKRDVPLVWTTAAPSSAFIEAAGVASIARMQRPLQYSLQARLLLLQGDGLVDPSPRASRGHILIVRPLRAQGTTKLPPHHVSIISNRASNSCPQAVQRMQSDSTVNSSDLIPMPPQSGQRARWTL